MRKPLILVLVVVVIALVAFVATRRNAETGQTALDHSINAVDNKLGQAEAQLKADTMGNSADAHFDAASSATTVGGTVGNFVEGVGDSMQQGANQAKADMNGEAASQQGDAAKNAVTGQ